MPNGHMTTKEAASYLGLAHMTLHNYRHHGKGPKCTKSGRAYVYKAADLDAWNKVRADKASAGKATRGAKPRARRPEAAAAA